MKRKDRIKAFTRLRSYREKQARGELGETQRAAQEAHEKLAADRDRHDSQPPLPPRLTPLQLRTLQLQGIKSLELLGAAAAVFEAARLESEAARIRWRRSKDDLRSAEKLEHRRTEEAAYEARVASQAAMDQLVLLLKKRVR